MKCTIRLPSHEQGPCAHHLQLIHSLLIVTFFSMLAHQGFLACCPIILLGCQAVVGCLGLG